MATTLTTSKISDIWSDLTDCKMEYVDGDDTITLITNAAFKNHIIKYLDWSFLHISTTDAIDAFEEYWEFFCDQNKFNFWRVYTALMDEYNPLHNYDKTSQIVTENVEHTDTQKNPTVKVTSSGGTTTSTDSTMPYDSNSFVDKEQNTVIVPSMYTTTDPYNIETEYGATEQTVTENTSGNIGTTTSATMLTEELTVRINNLTDYIMKQFINEYLFLNDTIY